MEVVRLNKILDKWKKDPDFTIEILQDIQDEERYLPADAMRYIANALRIPQARIVNIATFYKAFSLEPRGRHEIQVCTGTACHVQGAARVVEALERELTIKAGKTTEDGEYTLEAVRCVGACGLAPVVAIDEEIHGHLSPDKAVRRVAKHKKEVAK
jgi:NADH-quinone oxidoreductase subunit E